MNSIVYHVEKTKNKYAWLTCWRAGIQLHQARDNDIHRFFPRFDRKGQRPFPEPHEDRAGLCQGHFEGDR